MHHADQYPVTVYAGPVRTREDGFVSAISKTSISGELELTLLGLSTDQQAEKKVHGGSDRALCHYPREHYAYWRSVYPDSLSLRVAPALGENLSSEGMTEENVYIGDIFHWGESLIQVTQPRSPCYKVSRYLNIERFAVEMQETGYCGWLYRVIQPGKVSADVPLTLIARISDVSVQEAVALAFHQPFSQESCHRLLNSAGLSASWCGNMVRRLANQQIEGFNRRLFGN